MATVFRSLTVCIAICLLQTVSAVHEFSAEQTDAKDSGPEKRPVTVADAIRMSKLGDPGYYRGASSRGRVVQFSPDGKQFVVVLRKGNIERNTNEYSLLLWRTDYVLSDARAPEVLLTMASSSNREAIKSIFWLNDNNTLAFLGENPGESQQLYTFNTHTRALTKLTNSPTNLLSYSINVHADRIVFIAQEPIESIFTDETRRDGVPVSTQWLPDLILGQTWSEGSTTGEDQLFLQITTDIPRRLRPIGKLSSGSTPSMSPDGRYVVVTTQVSQIPDSWKGYSDPWIRRETVHELVPGEYSWLKRYELVDTTRGISRVLVNAPMGANSKVVWPSDGHSVVISDTYLPLNEPDNAERTHRQSATFAVDVDISTGNLAKISDATLQLIRWDEKGSVLVCEENSGDKKLDAGSKVYFRKTGGGWQRLVEGPAGQTRPEIILEEDMNTAPRLVAVDVSLHRKMLLLDLNPQFKGLRFAKENAITWKASDGHEVKGGLYFPVDYVPGGRYPLVIQTHFFNPDKFWIDGPWTTAYAAQPLAGENIMVLQADESLTDADTPKEVDRETAAFEGAIDYLDERGLIDRDRVGIIGFSRTNLSVLYALTHSKYQFAAASITDGVDGSYFQYTAFSNAGPAFARSTEALYGGPPYGQHMRTWLERSPGFNVEKLQTPLRITAQNAMALLDQWEWFAALRRLRKPVDMVYMQKGDHILQRPWERIVSQQGNVDWFRFWLKGEEDPDPAKAEQYKRWRELRKLQQQNEKNSPAPSPNYSPLAGPARR